MERSYEATLAHAAELIRAARHAVALTGAGISRPSGIPDFRSDSGLWAQVDPIEVASLRSFYSDPQRFYDWFRPLVDTMILAQPNPAHLALARLEQAGRLKAVITQNIDGLHQKAGSQNVIELHGHLRSGTCLQCERKTLAEYLVAQIRMGDVPYCSSCGGAVKPDVVLFDEDLPRGLFWLAQHEIERSDLILVAGTSLEVYPVSDLPVPALRRGAQLIIVNLAPTYLDERAAARFPLDVATTLPALADRVLGG